jgi:hypothetical protein
MAAWLERVKETWGASGVSNQPKGIFTDLRSMALAVDLASIQTPVEEPWGGAGVAMMEIGTDRAVASIVAIADGTVSMYLSTGGGVIGAGEHEAVRAEAKRFRTVVADSRGLAYAKHGFPASGARRSPLPGADGERWVQRCRTRVGAAGRATSVITAVRSRSGSPH